jgi:hypothetical protein
VTSDTTGTSGRKDSERFGRYGDRAVNPSQQTETSMTSPLEPSQHPEDPLVPPTPNSPPAAFSSSLGGSMALRVGIVAVAAIVLLISAALTFAASPAPSTDPGAGSRGTSPEANGDPAGPRGLGGLLGRLKGLRDGREFRQITITAIDGSNISLKTDDGWTRTITVTSATTYTKGGQSITLGDLRVGDEVRFRQTRNTDGTFTINAINVVLPSVAGEVTAVNGDTFTIKTRGNVTWTITTNGDTKYLLDGGNGAKADVKVGVKVGVVGTQSGESALTATAVRIEAARLAGKVTAKTADTITIERLGGGTATIHVSDSTKYHVPGKQDASLSDITVGGVILAHGRQRADGSIDAVSVAGGGKGLGRAFGDWPRPKNAPKATPNATPGSYSAG